MTKQDKRHQKFIEVGSNLRVTFVPASQRARKKDWAGQDVLRFNAYVGDKKRLHRGAEVPVGSSATVLELIAAICELCGGRSG
jgi:hypothetical protein